MRAFLDWQAGWWDRQVHRWEGLDSAQTEALIAYAKRQAHLRREMGERFSSQWMYAKQYAELGMVPEEDEVSTGGHLAEPESTLSFDQ